MKHNNYLYLVFFSFALACSFSSCSKDDVVADGDPASNYVKLSSGYINGASTWAEVYGVDSAYVGYNKLFVVLKDSVTGNYIDRASVSLMPMMNMGTMSHPAPAEQPVSAFSNNHLFESAAVFTMSSMGGSWSLMLQVVNNENGKSGSANLVIHVKDPVHARLFTFTSLIDQVTKYYVGLVEPAHPVVGINNLELVVFKKESMMSYPADSSMIIQFDPEMPDMGHGSPNNVNPIHVGKGHYQGKVNFTMSGLWHLALQFKQGDEVADSANGFDIDF